MSLPITVCIPTRNEAKNLPICLESLQGSFAQVVIVDSNSTDETRAIAETFGASVLDFRWNGKSPKKRNWALQNYPWETPWVLFLDADERVTSEFICELEARIPKASEVGFWVRFTDWFMGKPLHYGDVFRKLALFRIGAGEYEQFPEEWWSDLDMEVHEHPVLDGALGDIQARLEHHDYRGLHSYIWRHNEYSTWETQRFLWLALADGAEWGKLTSRQKFKYRHLDKIWFASLYFLTSYIVKGGFRDGAAGWYFAILKRRYFTDIRLKISEARRGGMRE